MRVIACPAGSKNYMLWRWINQQAVVIQERITTADVSRLMQEGVEVVSYGATKYFRDKELVA